MELYQQTIKTVCAAFHVDPHIGLSDSEIPKRQKKYGFNEIPDIHKKTWFSIFISQFQNALIYVLLIAALLIFFVSDKTIDAFIVSGILLFNAILGTIQEGRAQTILESLKQFMRNNVLVLRNGLKIIVPEKELVPGDIIFMHQGERIPADARVLETNSLSVDESILTGEQIAVYKTTQIIIEKTPIYLQTNMLFKGTTILSGTVSAIVVRTGQNTEIGTLHTSISEIKTDTPLKKALEQLSVVILLCITTICLFLFGIGLLAHKPIKELFTLLIALFICIIPEGLPLILTLVLVGGARKLAKNRVLVRNMQAVETVGHTNTLVIDKTGTITKNELMVKIIYADNTQYTVSGNGYDAKGAVSDRSGDEIHNFEAHKKLKQFGIITTIFSDAEIIKNIPGSTYTIKGNQTEAALKIAARKMKLEEIEQNQYKKIAEIPFRSDLQFHAALCEHKNAKELFLVGSPEAIFVRSEAAPFFQESLQHALSAGYRCIAVASKPMPAHSVKINEAEDGFSLIGIAALQDTIRTDVQEIITQARASGLQIIMATGDHAMTAKLIAKEVGIFTEGDHAIDGSELALMSDQELYNVIEKTTLFSRMLPEYKMRIITALRSHHKIVAMTGDGVNDAPALVFADIGIAMGSGTDVAKESADIVLLDDSFQYIIKAIVLGRHIFHTLQRVILYFFATNLSELFIIVFVFLGELFFKTELPLPLTAAQILWLNLVTDGFLDVGLSMEKEDPRLLSQVVQEPETKLLNISVLWISIYSATIMATGSLFIFSLYCKQNLVYAQTMTLITMAMFQWFNAWNCRSLSKSIFSLGFFSNLPLIGVTLFVLLLQIGVIYIPYAQYLFDTTPLSIMDWVKGTTIASSIILCEEVRKYISTFFKKIVQ